MILSYATAFNRACFYLSKKLRTTFEVRSYLYKIFKNEPNLNPVVDEVLKKLKELNYIDDIKYIKAYINTSKIKKPKSKFLLKNELIKKGINSSLIDEYFDTADFSDDKECCDAIEKLQKKYRNIEYSKAKRRVVNSLLRMGFSYDVIFKNLKSF